EKGSAWTHSNPVLRIFPSIRGPGVATGSVRNDVGRGSRTSGCHAGRGEEMLGEELAPGLAADLMDDLGEGEIAEVGVTPFLTGLKKKVHRIGRFDDVSIRQELIWLETGRVLLQAGGVRQEMPDCHFFPGFRCTDKILADLVVQIEFAVLRQQQDPG